MGIIELHFHDVDFSPSMGRGGSSDEGALDEEMDDWETESDDSGGLGKGALVALLVLVALGAVVGMKRRRSSGSGGEGDEEIQIRE